MNDPMSVRRRFIVELADKLIMLLREQRYTNTDEYVKIMREICLAVEPFRPE